MTEKRIFFIRLILKLAFFAGFEAALFFSLPAKARAGCGDWYSLSFVDAECVLQGSYYGCSGSMGSYQEQCVPVGTVSCYYLARANEACSFVDDAYGNHIGCSVVSGSSVNTYCGDQSAPTSTPTPRPTATPTLRPTSTP
ncbi:MAG: hypothetical protein JW991_00005, partial [Candidatus Pacebacteria bacterium]|nr:hypothetical protein [Candidatus Paceibacterota bacterium]